MCSVTAKMTVLMNGFSRVLGVFKTLISSSSNVSTHPLSSSSDVSASPLLSSSDVSEANYSGDPETFHPLLGTIIQNVSDSLVLDPRRTFANAKTSRMTHYGFASKYKTGEIAENGVDRVISKSGDSVVDGVKTRERKILAYLKVREFFATRSFDSRCRARHAFLGRSMIEMLGVLAIIGVLSVGGIAGYSKAMRKYKLNKQSEQINMVIDAVNRHLGKFQQGEIVSTTLIATGDIPDEMIKSGDNYYIYDPFDNRIYLKCPSVKNGLLQMFYIVDAENEDNIEVCRNFMIVAKAWSKDLYYYSVLNGSSNSTDNPLLSSMYYGDKYCNSTDRKCIKDITISEIDTLCRFNAGATTSPHFKISWPSC